MLLLVSHFMCFIISTFFGDGSILKMFFVSIYYLCCVGTGIVFEEDWRCCFINDQHSEGHGMFCVTLFTILYFLFCFDIGYSLLEQKRWFDRHENNIYETGINSAKIKFEYPENKVKLLLN